MKNFKHSNWNSMKKHTLQKSESKLESAEVAASRNGSAKSTEVPKRSSMHATPVTIVAKYDAGWGNSLTLRGEGPGLSWNTGAPMCCVNGAEWVWVAPAPGTVVFKVLYNDIAWSLGEDSIAGPGETATVSPKF